MPPSSARGSWPITWRLSFLYALASFAMLVIASGFLYEVLKTSLAREDNRFITDKILSLRAILHERDRNDLYEELGTGMNGSQPARYYGRVMDEGGRILAQTPGMEDILPRSLTLPPPYRSTKELEKGASWKAKNGRHYLFMAAWDDSNLPGEQKNLIQAGIDVSEDYSILSEYRKKLGLVLILGILFSTVAGISVARRGMRPLEKITKVIQKITATRLHERIVSRGWPKELTTLAAAFDGMFDRLEDSFARLSRFSADLAHELRTPITNLKGTAEVALARARTAEEYREVIESNLEEHARLSRIIDSLLFLARAESSNISIARKDFDARSEIEMVTEFYEALAEEREIEVVAQGNARISSDPALFRRAFSNLLGNAIHYTSPGGTITISVKEAENDHSVEVMVADSGMGIEPEHLSRIFDRFYRTDKARAENPQGSGLGLSIVKSIMDLHSGDIVIRSDPSMGTTVILRFPAPVI